MLLFCPTCSNVLSVEEASGKTLYRFACPTCPYVYNISKKVRYRSIYTLNVWVVWGFVKEQMNNPIVKYSLYSV